MARARNIKPSLFKNELLGEADPLLTILFQGLWCLADREGRLEDRPKRIKAEIFPYRELPDFNGYLTELEQLGFIERYSVGEVAVILVLNFVKHQSPHKTEKDSELPAKPEFIGSHDETEDAALNNGSLTVKESLNPDSLLLNPDSNKQPSSAKPPKAEPKFSDDDLRCAEFIFAGVQRVAPKTKTPNLDTWANHVRLMREQDNLTHREICEVFTWANKHSFWSTNILSVKTLRDKFAALSAKKESEHANNGQNSGNGFQHAGGPSKLSTVSKNSRAADEYRRARAQERGSASDGAGGLGGDIVGEIG